MNEENKIMNDCVFHCIETNEGESFGICDQGFTITLTQGYQIEGELNFNNKIYGFFVKVIELDKVQINIGYISFDTNFKVGDKITEQDILQIAETHFQVLEMVDIVD